MKTTSKVNGLDTEKMFETIEAIKSDPTLAKFEFRASNKWIQGGAGREDDSRKEPFVFTNGEPPVLLGNNEGGNPVEFLLHALAGCVTTTLVLHAAARGIRIERISTELKGNIDLQGLLDLDPSVAPGYESIRIDMDIKADCPDEDLEMLIDFAHGHSPVCQTVCRPIPVVLKRVRK
jgi:uncharacterized OsmC-like protein